MAKIKLTLDHELVEGEHVTFRAPCDCTAVDGITVTYPRVSENSVTMQSTNFTFRDAHNNALTNLGNLFSAEALVIAVLDKTKYRAYIVNAANNKYLDDKFKAVDAKFIYSSSEPTGSKGKIWLKPVT